VEEMKALYVILPVIILIQTPMVFLYITDAYPRLFQGTRLASFTLSRSETEQAHEAKTLYTRAHDSSKALAGKSQSRGPRRSQKKVPAGQVPCKRVDTCTNPVTVFTPLPRSVINNIKTFVFFVGISRSGHSIVAAILDSHPHIVVSNELDVFSKINNHSSEDCLFNLIWEKSYRMANRGGLERSGKGYTLSVKDHGRDLTDPTSTSLVTSMAEESLKNLQEILNYFKVI